MHYSLTTLIIFAFIWFGLLLYIVFITKNAIYDYRKLTKKWEWVGEHKVPAPYYGPVQAGDVYYIALDYPDFVKEHTWYGDKYDYHNRHVGLIHMHRLDAKDHGRALHDVKLKKRVKSQGTD